MYIVYICTERERRGGSDVMVEVCIPFFLIILYFISLSPLEKYPVEKMTGLGCRFR